MSDAKSIAATAWTSGNTSKASHHNLIEPEQRVVPHFLFVQIISVMKTKFQKSLDYQQKVNEAVNALVNKFSRKDGVQLSDEFELFSDVQTKIMSMQALCDLLERKNDDLACKILIDTADITMFFNEISEIFKLLKPFDSIAEENWQTSRQND